MSNFESWKIFFSNFNQVKGFDLWAYHFVKRIQCWQKEFATPCLEKVLNEQKNTFFKLNFRLMKCPFEVHLSLLNHASEMLHQCYQTENLGYDTLKKIISWFRIIHKNRDVLGEHYADSEEYVALVAMVENYIHIGDDVLHAREGNHNLRNYIFFDPKDLFTYIAHVVRHHFNSDQKQVGSMKTWSVVSGEMMHNVEYHVGLDSYSEFLEKKVFSRKDVEWLQTPDLFLLTLAFSKKDMDVCRSLKNVTVKEGSKIHQCYAFCDEMLDLAYSVRKDMTNREKSCHSLRLSKHGNAHCAAPNRTLPQCEDDNFVTGYHTLYHALPTKNGNHHTVYFGNGTTRKRKHSSNLPWHSSEGVCPPFADDGFTPSDQSKDSMDDLLESPFM